MKRKLFWVLAIAVVALIIIFYGQQKKPSKSISISYACDNNKSIEATLYEGVNTPVKPGERPQPSGSADIKLSDGRKLNLKQTISADGIRYANNDESFIFWSKGNGALVLENNEQKSYIGCILVKPASEELSQVYENGSKGFSLSYPSGYTVDESYKYQEFGPGKDINGVKFTIPASLAKGTNLGADSYLSVEQIPQTKVCTANLFLDNKNINVQKITDNNTEYSVASTTGAGAGNRYEETVYAFPYTNPCIAVRYFIHYSVFQNYPTGTVKEFDKQSLLEQLDQIRQTLIINQ